MRVRAIETRIWKEGRRIRETIHLHVYTLMSLPAQCMYESFCVFFPHFFFCRYDDDEWVVEVCVRVRLRN